ncbi:hypothetical protein [Pleionea sp. CnH1-48]|uniref:hypothetical protein n=1 Tax=Pleionea sp. CnH1-48 TaxID=2954494 RepID=UPI002096B8E3|nr:hypothetical protein [Pleionea sp. CnH1-48]MCO7223024.1 hypothetical protein [Pleionea sp. CnH1-48]
MDDLPVLEVMYPGYWLGCFEEIQMAMSLNKPLAIDVSHLYIQLNAGVITQEQINRIYDYHKVSEIHVSSNNGKRDNHMPIDQSTYGLDWSRERAKDGIPVVLECYMHKLSHEQRTQQINLLKKER